jgi:NADH:ubiquinone oxidoreductase subunit H
LVPFVLIGTIFFTLPDELVMGCGQRRIGPLNLGRYGIPPSIINGRNPIIAQSPFPKVNIHIHFGYQSFPVMFLPSSLRNYIIPSPFSLVDIYLPIILSIILTGLALVFIIFTPISARSKHSVPGSIRIIPQLIPLELIFTTILLLTIRSWNDPPMGICAAA